MSATEATVVALRAIVDEPCIVFPPSIPRSCVDIGSRSTTRSVTRFDSATGVYESINPPVDAFLQSALLRKKPLRFWTPVPGAWNALRSPKREQR